MKSIKKCVLNREVIMVPFPGINYVANLTCNEGKKKKIDFFKMGSPIYSGTPNACFVPGNRQ